MRDPRKRPDAATILKHEWLQNGASVPDAPIQPEILLRLRKFAGMNRFKKEALRVRPAAELVTAMQECSSLHSCGCSGQAGPLSRWNACSGVALHSKVQSVLMRFLSI